MCVGVRVNLLSACRHSLLNIWQTRSIDKLEIRWLRESIIIAVFILVPENDGKLLYKSSPADIQAQRSEKQGTIHNLHPHAHTKLRNCNKYAHIHKTDY